MKFNLFVKGFIGLAGLTSISLAKETNECEEIKEYLKNNEYVDKIIKECSVNDEGKVTTLKIKNVLSTLTQEDIDKLTSYKTLNSLEYEYRQKYYFKRERYNRDYNEEEIEKENVIIVNSYASDDEIDTIKLPNFKLDGLSNLNEFTLKSYADYYDPNPYFSEYKIKRGVIDKSEIKLPNSLKKIYIKGLVLNQNLVNSIADVTNLKDLTLDSCGLTSLSFSSLKNISLTLKDEDYSSYENELGSVKENVIKELDNINELTFDNIELENFMIKELAKLTNLQKLSFVHCKDYNYNSLQTSMPQGWYEKDRFDIDWDLLKSLSNLKVLNIKGENDVIFNMSFVNALTSLNKLYMDHAIISENHLEKFDKLTNLEELYMNSINYISGYIENNHKDILKEVDIDIESILKLNNLKKLTIKNNNVCVPKELLQNKNIEIDAQSLCEDDDNKTTTITTTTATTTTTTVKKTTTKKTTTTKKSTTTTKKSTTTSKKTTTTTTKKSATTKTVTKKITTTRTVTKKTTKKSTTTTNKKTSTKKSSTKKSTSKKSTSKKPTSVKQTTTTKRHH